MNNIGDPDSMRTAIFATLFHCMSTDADPHHSRCPDGEDSWCFYNKAIARNEEPALHEDKVRHAISHDVAQAMVDIYLRMSDMNLLKRLSKGKTQNPNECLHSVIWSRCCKTIFVSRHKLQGAAASAISTFNAGARQLTDLMSSIY